MTQLLLFHRQSLFLDISGDFAGFAALHADEYQELARKVSGRALKVRMGGSAAPSAAPSPARAVPTPAPEDTARQRQFGEASREPAVQEALDLFNGKVIDVRETKPAKEAP